MGFSHSVPWWYWPLSGLALLWGLGACAAFFLATSAQGGDQTTVIGLLAAVTAAGGTGARSAYVIWAQLSLAGGVALLLRSFWAVFAYFVALPVLFFNGWFALFSDSFLASGVPWRILLGFFAALAVTGGWACLAGFALFRGWMRR